jgi:hypothetical protein
MGMHVPSVDAVKMLVQLILLEHPLTPRNLYSVYVMLYSRRGAQYLLEIVKNSP